MLKSEVDKFKPIKSLTLFEMSEYFTNIVSLYRKNNLPKVILLSGEKGSGKFTLAFHLINFFFSDRNKNLYDFDRKTIHSENVFYKKILLNINENFNYLGKIENKTTNIENVRNLKKIFFTTPLNNKPRFTILDDCDQLNKNSANALLKLIEEPSNLNYFILINNKRGKLIDTLKSRSLEFKIFLKNNEKKLILENLSNQYDINLDDLLPYINNFSPGVIIKSIDCLHQLEIKVKDSLYDSSNILLDMFKKTKNDIYLETIKFLTDVHFNYFILNKKFNIIDINNLRFNFIKRLIEFEKFSLSKNLVLESFKKLPKYV